MRSEVCRALEDKWDMQFAPPKSAYVITLDRQRRYSYTNEAWMSFNGIRDAVGRHVWKVMGDDFYDLLQPQIELAFSLGRHRSIISLPYGECLVASSVVKVGEDWVFQGIAIPLIPRKNRSNVIPLVR